MVCIEKAMQIIAVQLAWGCESCQAEDNGGSENRALQRLRARVTVLVIGYEGY